MTTTFHSPKPKLFVANIFPNLYDNAVATARTCYSSTGIIKTEDVALKPKLRDRIAASLYEAGHHTTFQHGYVQFGIENVSRHFVWSFLHSHPYYNSEQVSQRYVKVAHDQMTIPPLNGKALEIYKSTIEKQIEAYENLIRILIPTVEVEYFRLFPSRISSGTGNSIARRTIPRKAMEVARYVLPVAAHTYLYHTVSLITLLRYHRLCLQYDVPFETRTVVEDMVSLVMKLDPDVGKLLMAPIPLEETIEYRFWNELNQNLNNSLQTEFHREFDQQLDGYTSRLVSYKQDNEVLLSQSIREVLGVPASKISDSDAIALVLDPRMNSYLGEAINLTTMSKLTRTLHHPGYTFRKKLSHTADSQDQRHRMVPGSRPMLTSYLTESPDYITPKLIAQNDEARSTYDESMESTWESIRKLLALGVPKEYVCYLLPNSVAIRFTESSDLLSLHHKLRMRLCYNAQEEIFAASLDETLQIAEVNPGIGKYLGAPCTLRYAANSRPYCPEGDRYCGVPVWKKKIEEFERLI